MFAKILIANRGEIACRVIRTAKKLGIGTVAVYSDADSNALHVQMADEAVHIGGSAPADSYLLMEKVLEAAIQTGSEAIHPGYGFLSENALFCQLCETNNVVFIGPPEAAIKSMGSKSAAKMIMQEAGVPLLPGYHGTDQNPILLKKAAGKRCQVAAEKACDKCMPQQSLMRRLPRQSEKPYQASATATYS